MTIKRIASIIFTYFEGWYYFRYIVCMRVHTLYTSPILARLRIVIWIQSFSVIMFNIYMTLISEKQDDLWGQYNLAGGGRQFVLFLATSVRTSYVTQAPSNYTRLFEFIRAVYSGEELSFFFFFNAYFIHFK